MRSIVEPRRFIDAVEHISRGFFSTPYEITPMVDRWFNQLAMIEVPGKKPIHLSGALAREYMDITIDGVLIDKKDIESVFYIISTKSTYKEDKERLLKDIEQLQYMMLFSPERASKAFGDVEAAIAKFKAEKARFKGGKDADEGLDDHKPSS